MGVDIGWTFSDIVAVDESGRISVAEVPSTPREQAEAVLRAFGTADVDLAEVSYSNHRILEFVSIEVPFSREKFRTSYQQRPMSDKD